MPDTIPLPELPAAIQHKLAVAKADALVVLYEELQACWNNCTLARPRLTVDPGCFIQAFVEYGVALYEAQAAALLELRPTLWEYQAWLNFALKTLICDELAPYRSPEELKAPARTRRLSEWQAHMGATWRLSDHGDLPTSFSEAKRLIDALEDSTDDHRSQFISALHIAISRRTMPLSRDALKVLGPVSEALDSKREVGPTSWAEVEICFLSDDRVQLTAGKHTETLNYADFGFADGRSQRPNLAWVILRALAVSGGTIGRPPDAKGWPSVEKRMQKLRKMFRARFKLDDDPLPFVEGVGYRAQFKICCASSFNS